MICANFSSLTSITSISMYKLLVGFFGICCSWYSIVVMSTLIHHIFLPHTATLYVAFANSYVSFFCLYSMTHHHFSVTVLP